MGQAPATGKISLRTVPRNFPGRSGTKEDQVYLCSPETAAASALTGVITDPRTLEMPYPKFREPKKIKMNTLMLISPLGEGNQVTLEKGPNIKPLPHFSALKNTIQGPVLLKMGDNISTDTIMPAGAKVLPYRSNIPGISQFVFAQIDEKFVERALPYQQSGSIVIAGENYGQGSSREHAAIAPRYLGLEAVIAKSFARIHAQNLVNFGILPLYFIEAKDYEDIRQEDILVIENIREAIQNGVEVRVSNQTRHNTYHCRHHLSPRQIQVLLAGGLINTVKNL
jgi:aconitate hydratase